jgi:predicted nucleic acid-binding protein
VGEFVRKRTEWVAEQAAREGVDRGELRRRLRVSRERVNLLVNDLSATLLAVNHRDAPAADLTWLRDQDDWPVMQTALAARADVIVTENTNDFPVGERHHDVLFLTPQAFLTRLYAIYSTAAADVSRYLRAEN